MNRTLKLGSAVWLTLALTACGGGETNFSNSQQDNQNQVGTGMLEVIPAAGVVWEGLVPGYPCTEYVRIDSVGIENLNIDRVDIVDSGDGVFSLPDTHSNITIAPGDSYELTVQASLSSLTLVTGELRIKSNDEETVDLRLPLTANPAADWDTGDTGEPPC